MTQDSLSPKPCIEKGAVVDVQSIPIRELGYKGIEAGRELNLREEK